MKNVLIRCDASIEIGLGHITRCLVLANELRDAKYNVYFAMKNYFLGIGKVVENSFEVCIASSNNFKYDRWIIDLANEKKIDIFIGDIRDGLTLQTIKKLKKMDILTIAIDEPSEYRKACDLCFYPPVPQIDKLDWDGFEGKIYKGFEYIILRPEFYKEHKKHKNNKPNILVMMGGTDSYNLTLEVLNKLLILNKDVNISVIISKNHKDYAIIKSLNNSKVTLYSNIKNMADFLEHIDYGIISFGVSAYELLAMQIPAIHVCLDEDHTIASQLFVKHNYAKSISKNEIAHLDIDFFDKNIYQKKVIFKNNIMQTIIKHMDLNEKEKA